MKQIIRRVIDRKGKIVKVEYPEPHLGSDQVLVENHYSLISSGTELSTLSKTPAELVKQTLSDPWMRNAVKQTVFTAGVTQTTRRIWQEMTMAREIGYSGAGRVLAVGGNVEGIKVGEKVAYAATGHAEIAAPSINHIVPVSESVDLRHACFVTVGGIATQALRRADIHFGEVIAIYGLGLVGQICMQICRAAGCVVVGIDVSDSAIQLAKDNGADLVLDARNDDVERKIMEFTGKHGVDATVICANAKSNIIINNAMKMTRRQGRVVIVGYVGLDVHPKNFLYREIDLRYSRAYGPGSYHRAYEKGRVDYPYDYVRWTEQRNLSEFIRQIRNQSVNLEALIEGTYAIDQAQQAFDTLAKGKMRGVAVLLDYQGRTDVDRSRSIAQQPRVKKSGKIGIAIVGCGNHVLAQHLPNLKAMEDVHIVGIASATGKNATMVAKQAGVKLVTSELETLITDAETDAVLICSDQPSHAEHVIQTINAGKAVFVEKPMVTLLSDYYRVSELMSEEPILFTLGLNRRYSPMTTKLIEQIESPIEALNYMISLPMIPVDHWSLDEIEGGGRLISEGEHFLDLCHLIIDKPPIAIFAKALGREPDDLRKLCGFAITIHYEGAVATITLTESASQGRPRERITTFGQGQIMVLDDFSTLTVHGKKLKNFGTAMKQEMGHNEQLQEFVSALKGKPNKMLNWQIASLATLSIFAAQESIRCGEVIDMRAFSDSLYTTGRA